MDITIYKSDMFKNNRDSTNPKFEHSFPIDITHEHLLNKEIKVRFFLCDPPYVSANAGHTVNNCDWEKSFSRMKFNDAYGIGSMKYSNDSKCFGLYFIAKLDISYHVQLSFQQTVIVLFYVRLFMIALDVLSDDGYVLVKSMNSKNFDLTEAIEEWAMLSGLVREGNPQQFPTGPAGSEKHSTLTVYKRRTSQYGICAMLGNDAHSNCVKRLEDKVKSQLVESVKEDRRKTLLWQSAIDVVQSILSRLKHFSIIELLENSFPGLDAHYKLKLDHDGDNWMADINNMDHVFEVQRRAVLYHSLTLTTMNVFGICFNELQIQSTSDRSALRREIVFPVGFWKVLERAKVGSESLGSNVKLLQKMCQDGQKEDADLEGRNTPRIDDYYQRRT